MKVNKKKKILSMCLISVVIFASCDPIEIEGKDVGMGDIHVEQTPPIDSCCELKFPAKQAEVSGTDLFSKQFRIESFRHADGNFRYKIKFDPSNNFQSVLQSFINYANALYPCVTGNGSSFRVSKGAMSGGHLGRQVAWVEYLGFAVNGGGIIYNNLTNFWDSYFDIPTTIPPNNYQGTHSAQNGLEYNQVYALEFSYWIDGCNWTQKEKDCLWYRHYVNFSIETNTNRSSEKVGIVKFYSDNGEIINETKIDIK